MFKRMESVSKMWQEEEEDDDDEFFFGDDDDNIVMAYEYLQQQASGSRRRRRRNADAPPRWPNKRDHSAGDAQIRADYFSPDPVYSPMHFRRRFRMRPHVFMRLVQEVEKVDPYFQFKYDAFGRAGLSALQKCVGAIRVLAYGVPADAVDEYVRIGESTARESLQHFCAAVIHVFGKQYLRAPTREDVARILHQNEQRGWPGMLGSIDCMHWEWRNCPVAWKGQFTGRGKHPSMILEAVATYDLWIWHAYFGMPGSCNDINVLQRSPVFSPFLRDYAAPSGFMVNGNSYEMGYFLADGIYPEWPAFVKTIRNPVDRKKSLFAAAQEATRKDIERAFGVLQARWAVVRGPAYGWDRDQITYIMTTCIILHNMIIEDEKELATNRNFASIGDLADPTTGSNRVRQSFVQRLHKLKNKTTHQQLQHDLIEHLWTRHGSQ